MTLRSVPGRTPRIHPGAWVDPAALVIGDVELAEGVSIWPFAVVRGDEGQYIRIGRNSNVQDGSVVHVTPESPCIIGEGVTIGHRCVVHACTVGNNVRIGIGAVVLTGAVIEDNAQVGAGAVVPPGKVVSAGTLVTPAVQGEQRCLETWQRRLQTLYELAHHEARSTGACSGLSEAMTS